MNRDESVQDDRGATVTTDDCTRNRWSRVSKTKDEAYNVIEWFINLIKTHHAPHRVLEIMLDSGREFGGQKLEILTQVMSPETFHSYNLFYEPL